MSRKQRNTGKNGNGGNLGFEAELFLAADKLRKNLEPSDYRIGEFETAETGLTEITHRRTYSRPKPPPRAISTIHKAKGLECESVIVMPIDAKTFPNKPDARCLFYVAISRPMKRLLLVVSRNDPSPLLEI